MSDSSPNMIEQTSRSVARCVRMAAVLVSFTAFLSAGCGTIQQSSATEQLLASDAVDTAISRIDFRAMSSEKVFFETRYIQNLKTIGFVSAEYIISSLRQAMTAQGLLLQDSAAQADYILEARVGTLGADSQEMVYGLPASGLLTAASTAVAAVSQTPAPPTIPEISFAKKKNQFAAAKVACFAYHRESRERVWQSGLSTGKSTAKDTWVLGAGPFQKGTIYDGTGIAGSSLNAGDGRQPVPKVGFREQIVFERTPRKGEIGTAEVIPAGGEKK